MFLVSIRFLSTVKHSNQLSLHRQMARTQTESHNGISFSPEFADRQKNPFSVFWNREIKDFWPFGRVTDYVLLLQIKSPVRKNCRVTSFEQYVTQRHCISVTNLYRLFFVLRIWEGWIDICFYTRRRITT